MCIFIQWLRVKLSSVIQPNGRTPLPSGVVVAIFCSMFANAVSMHMLFAFLPDMVKSFGITDEDVGYYVGLLASAVFFGKFISSYFWGWLSDRIGRRQVLLWCTSLLTLTTLAFGFSKSFEVALVLRFITGLIAGIAGTTKACMSDVCDNSNQALGMSVIVTAWNSGLIVGPALGGYLAKPASKYSVFKGSSFFENFAYVFPCLVNSALSFISFLLVFFIFPETLTLKRKTKDKELQPISIVYTDETSVSSSPSNRQRSTVKTSQSLNDLPNNYNPKQYHENPTIGIQKPLRPDMRLLSGSVSILPELYLQSYPYVSGSMDSIDKTKAEPYVPPDGKHKSGALGRTYESMKRSKLVKLCRNKDVRYCVAHYTVFSFGAIAENEMYSVWAATGRELGGLDYDTNDLGFTLMVVGVACAVSNCIFFPQLVKVFGLMKTQFLTISVVMFFTVILPTTNILYGRDEILKVVVIVIVMLIRVAEGCCFAGQFIFLGNSVPSSLRATAHGFATSMVCAARSFSPIVGGSIYSWSITSGLGFPFNEKCVFIFLGAVFWSALVVACLLDEEAVTKQSVK